MPRSRRVFPPGVAVHIIQRGNNRAPVFQGELDFRVFLELVARATVKHHVAVHVFTLMTNHFHLMATPAAPNGVPKFMQDVESRYVRYYNRRYERIGTLWNGRYRGILIENESYLLTCLRYIEHNPVRAGMVTSASDYPWTSYAAHALGRWPEWLTPHYVYMALGQTSLERRTAYGALCGQELPEHHLSLLK